MNRDRKTEIRVGITVIVGVILLTWIIIWAKNLSVFNDDVKLKIEFDSVAGLETGDAVTISGLKRGNVEQINLEKNKIIVTISLNKDVELRKDSDFFIQMADLMGTKKIDVFPGKSKELIDFTKIQKGYFSGDISTAMAMLSSVQDDLVTMIKDFKVTLDKVNNLLDDNLQAEIKSSVKNISDLSLSLNKMINENRVAVKSLLEEGKKLVQTGNEFIKTNSEEVNLFIKKSNGVFENLNQLLAKSSNLIDQTSEGKNNLGRFLNDKELFDDLKKSVSELKSLMKLINKQIQGEGLKVDANIF
ncbi:MAG: MlaD family protein [Rhodothermaceae bacterium]